MLKVKICVALISALFGGVIFLSLDNTAEAVPICFDDVSLRNSAKRPTSSYPRTGMARYESTCNNVGSTTQKVGVVSYYANANGSPGATLHTPNARFKIFSIGRPASAVTIRVTPTTAGNRCDWTGGQDVIVARKAGNGTPVPLGSIDTGAFQFNISTAFFAPSNSKFGPNAWNYTSDLLVSATASYPIFCPINVQSLTPGIYITPTDDNAPRAAHTETFQRFNQAFAGNGTGPKAILGPGFSQTDGPITLYADVSADVEYSIPLTVSCDYTRETSFRIRYYDPDNNTAGNPPSTSQPNGTPRVAIYNDTTGALVTDRSITEGNDQYNEFGVPLNPDNRYSMVWYNIWGRNGIQVWLPFSESTNISGNSCPPTSSPPTCTITNTIRSGGFTLNWSSTNATSASLSGVGNVGTSGPRNVGATNTTYTLTVRGPGGTANCRTTTTVPANPSCSLTINNTALTITWSSSNATTMSINQGIGNVSTSGGTTGISPSLGTTTYTGTVVNAIGARDTCTRSITISPPSCNLTINSDATSISWTTTNAVSLTIDNGVGNATPVDSGVRTINPQFGTTTYNGTVRNIIGTTRTCDDSITISVPTCNSVQILRTNVVVASVPAGEPFATRVNLRNNNPFVIEVNSAGYTVNSPPSGSSRTNQSSTNSNNMSANSNASYRSNNTEDIRLNGPGTFTVSWTINTTRGTINCSGQVISTVEPITCTVARVENSIGLRFSVGVTLTNPNSIDIGITESSWDSTNITPASGVGVTVRGSSVTLDSDGGGVDLSSSITIDSRDDLEANTTGDRSVTWTIVTEYSDSDPTGDCGDNGTELGVTASPYPRFYGNDVFAGGGFGNCTIASGDVRSYGEFLGSPDHSTYVGAASELAIFAAGQIEQVLPGSQYDSRNRLDALSFANSSGATALADLGGSFGVPLCADSLTTVDSSTFSSLASTTLNLSSGDSGDYRRTGDVTISGGSSIVNGQRVQVYVDGDVLISENIIYSGANSGGWNSISDIPLIRVYATGNIYIDRNVNEISGLYAADGTVYTCTAGTTTFTGATFGDLSSDATGCRNKLTVYGSIVSNNIELHRTSGSYGQTDPAAIPEPYTSGNISESFVFSPELYLALLSEGTSNVTAKFDSILSLPPAF